MTDKATEARRGLVDTVVGKAKEVAGAVTGNENLTDAGQLQQAGAQARKEANSREALADAESHDAADELRERTGEAVEQKRQSYQEAGQREQAVVQSAEDRKADVDALAAAHEAAGHRAAEHRADAVGRQSEAEAAQLATDALRTEKSAQQEQARLRVQAETAELTAARLRDQTDTNTE